MSEVIEICTSERVSGCADEDGGCTGGVVLDIVHDGFCIERAVREDDAAVFGEQGGLGGSGMHCGGHGVVTVAIRRCDSAV